MHHAELRVEFAHPSARNALLAEMSFLEEPIRCTVAGCTLRLFGGSNAIAEVLDAFQRWLATSGRDSVTVEVDRVPYVIRAGAWLPRGRLVAAA